jgi:hypothetical protein
MWSASRRADASGVDVALKLTKYFWRVATSTDGYSGSRRFS